MRRHAQIFSLNVIIAKEFIQQFWILFAVVCVITCCKKKNDFNEWFGRIGRNAVYDPRTTTAPSSTTVLPGNSQSWTYPPKVVRAKASFQGLRFREGRAWQCEKLVMNPVTLKISQDIIYYILIICSWVKQNLFIYTVIISDLFAVPTGTP